MGKFRFPRVVLVVGIFVAGFMLSSLVATVVLIAATEYFSIGGSGAALYRTHEGIVNALVGVICIVAFIVIVWTMDRLTLPVIAGLGGELLPEAFADEAPGYENERASIEAVQRESLDHGVEAER